MSFVRPEAEAALRRWFEPVLWTLIALWGGWLLLSPDWLLKGAGAVMLAGALPLGLAAFRKARRPGAEGAPGVVTITERELLYMGPTEGGSVSLDQLTSVRIEVSDAGPHGDDVVWVFLDDAGSILRVPNGAVGTEGFFDALAPLPGVDFEAVLAALSSTEAGSHRVWQRALPQA